MFAKDDFEQFKEWARSSRHFQKTIFKEREAEYLRLVKEGQSPKALFIGCSDSRVVPDLFIDSKPGDLFVVRSAGNFVPIYDKEIPWDGVAASILYGIEVLGIREIIVCGHSHCGAIQALYQQENLENLDYIKKWIQFGAAAKKLVMERIQDIDSIEERNDLTGRLSVLFQLDHLMSYPSIRKRVEEGTLFLHGWYFILEKGRLDYYDPELKQFKSIKEILK